MRQVDSHEQFGVNGIQLCDKSPDALVLPLRGPNMGVSEPVQWECDILRIIWTARIIGVSKYSLLSCPKVVCFDWTLGLKLMRYGGWNS
jgi:hypothetical protein